MAAIDYTSIQVKKDFIPLLKGFALKYGITQSQAIDKMWEIVEKVENDVVSSIEPQVIIKEIFVDKIVNVEVIKEVYVSSSKDDSLKEFIKNE